jgi:hypothetical protein
MHERGLVLKKKVYMFQKLKNENEKEKALLLFCGRDSTVISIQTIIHKGCSVLEKRSWPCEPELVLSSSLILPKDPRNAAAFLLGFLVGRRRRRRLKLAGSTAATFTGIVLLGLAFVF